VILDWLGVRSSCFMLLYGIVGVALILLYQSSVRQVTLDHDRNAL